MQATSDDDPRAVADPTRADRFAAESSRRTARSSKDSIDHSPGGHDDLANAVAGAGDCIVAAALHAFPRAVFGTWGTPPPTSTPSRERIEAEMAAAVPICTINFNDPKNQWRLNNG